MRLTVDLNARVGDLDLNVAFESADAVTALSGPSGCGKTTTLDMIAGLRNPDRGRVLLDGELLFDSSAGVNLPPEKRHLGYVFQDARLFPHLTVRANLLYGAGRDTDLDEAIRPFGIAPLLDRWPRHLSGGETRRVAILRAFLTRPRLLLLDEPLAHLDPARAGAILGLIREIADAGTPILYVSHSGTELAMLRARIVTLGV